jgi:hypothetical protein
VTTGTMYDAWTIEAIPKAAKIVAGYVDGGMPNYEALCALFPHAYHVSITVTGLPNHRVVDCENGDLTPEQAAAWASAEIAAGRRPTIYCNASTWPSVQAAVAAERRLSSLLDYWIADYNGDPAIPAGAVAHQYASTAFDVSSTNGVWPMNHPKPPPTPKPKPTTEDTMPHLVEFNTIAGTYYVDGPVVVGAEGALLAELKLEKTPEVRKPDSLKPFYVAAAAKAAV